MKSNPYVFVTYLHTVLEEYKLENTEKPATGQPVGKYSMPHNDLTHFRLLVHQPRRTENKASK